jgi:hypothetical protein
MKVTIFKTIFETSDPKYRDLSVILNRIRDGASRMTVEAVRQGNKERKKDLPAVLFSGTFESRSDESIQDHNGLIVLDFDHVDVEATKSALAMDEHIQACWISPSGDGIKALTKITNPERHRDHFRALVRYFDERYGLALDESGKNESRACWESYDPDIIIKGKCAPFGKFVSEEVANAPPAAPSVSTTDYTKLQIAVRMIQNAADGEKHHVLIKAATLCGGYVAAGKIEEDEVHRILLREILKRNISSEKNAIDAIQEGVEYGKTRPIREIIQEEEEQVRLMEVMDGDMSFISSDEDDYHWIDDFSEGRIEHGLESGNETWDKYFRYKRELTIINGHSNVGKTTTALYLIVNSAIRHGWKWLIYSAENKTASVKMTLMQMAADKPVSSMTYSEKKNSYDWVKKHFYIVSNTKVYSYLDILLFMEKVHHYNKIDGVFVDPYNSLRLDLRRSEMQNTHDYHYEAATAFLTFSTNNNIAVWLNMHAVTEAQRRKGADGLPSAPYAEDTEGGGKFVNRADCFLTIHRKVQAPDPHIRQLSEVHVRKVRTTETGGKPTPLADPLTLLINSRHTGFTSSGLKPLVSKIDFSTFGEQTKMLDKMNWDMYQSPIDNNVDFLTTLPDNEEESRGSEAKSKEESR